MKRMLMVVGTFALSAMLVTACRSSDSVPYTTRIAETAEGGFVLTLDSHEGMSREALTRALLREAARATIDRGAIYLRVDELSDESSISVGERTRSSSDQPHMDPQTQSESSEVSIGRRRNGRILFVLSREMLPGRNVFDASALLDRIGSGTVPELSF